MPLDVLGLRVAVIVIIRRLVIVVGRGLVV